MVFSALISASLREIHHFDGSAFLNFGKRSFLLLLGLFRCRFLHIGSGFLQIVDNFAVQFIDAGLAVPLREILRPLLADGDFLVPLAAARDHACHHDGFSATLFGELGGRQIAQFVDQGLHAQVVHVLAVGGPFVARLGVALALDLYLAGVAETEIENLLIAEVVYGFFQRVGQIAVDFVQALYGGALGEDVLVLIAADLEALRAAGVGHGDGSHFACLGELLAGLRLGEIHLGIFEFADQAVHGRAIGTQGARLDDLPLVLPVLAEFDRRTFGGELNARQLFGIEGEQALVAQVVGTLIQAGLGETADRDHLGVVG